MKKLLSWLIIFSSFFVINSCQKELSYENGNNLSLGSLQDDGTGNCLPKTVNGTYIQATSLAPATNTINVSVNVTKTGSYTIYSDTVNGYYFLAKGIFAATGVNQVTLKGSGTPLASGINNFLIVYDSTACSIPITVLPLGSGGPASFTLAGTPGNCTGAVINGGYSIGVALNSFNTVVISVNVTTIGTYNISTTATNGMSFSGSGTFAATGVQTVVLNGSGTPVTSGNTTIPITAGSSSCSFTIPVGTPAVGTLGGAPGSCTSATISGIYVISTALTSSNTVQVQVNVTTVGVYTISTNTVSGFGFSASGTFNTTGSQLVTLNGTGTPTTTGPVTFTVTFGTSSCTFAINVQAIDYFPRVTNDNWSYENNDVSTDSVLIFATANTLNANSNTYTIFMQNTGTGPDSSGYYRKPGNDYYIYENISYFGFDNPVWGEYIFLKDNSPAPTSWTSPTFTGTVSSVPDTVRIRFTILQKDVPVSVTTSSGTVTYPNTIVVQEELDRLSGTSWIPLTSTIGYLKNYYSRNVGLILRELYNGSGTQNGKFAMRRFNLF